MSSVNIEKAPSVNEYKKRSYISQLAKRFRRNKLAIGGLVIVVVIILISIIGSIIIPYEAALEQNLTNRLQMPSSEHIFGTDDLGRDLLVRLIHGSRYSLLMGVLITFFSFSVGSILGAIAGYFGGVVDNVIMRIVDIVFSVPPLVIGLIVVAALGTSMVNIVIAFTIAYFVLYTRLIRGSIMTIKNMEYVENAKAIGCSQMRIVLRHILPNAIGPMIIQACMQLASSIVRVSALSFLGLGVQPPTPEWGSILAIGRTYLTKAPHIIFIVSAVLFVFIFSVNLMGDGLRDAFDPKKN